MPTYSPFLMTAIRAAKKAGALVLSYQPKDLSVQMKADNSPVTVADQKAEEIIIAEIKNAFPDHAFLGEESSSSGASSQYRWIIDPIDGTRNYIRGIPLFSTLISLMKGDECVLGVSYAPKFDELIYAEKGLGAFCNDQPIHVSHVDSLPAAYMSSGAIKKFVEKGQQESFIQLSCAVGNHRAFGDSWSYHLLSQGKIDIMVEADLKIWDIAPFCCIVPEAGGKVSDIHGDPITLSTTSFLATNGLLHEQTLAFFKSR